MKPYILVLLLLLNIACTKNYASPGAGEANSGQSLKEPTQRLGLGAASSERCPTGGMVYTIYGDADENGSFGENDVLIDQQVVCNGVQGANGNDGAGMVFEAIAASPEQCGNGGSLIMMAIDIDRSQSLTPADLSPQSILVCNGLNGADGHDGVNAPLPRFSPVQAIQACGDSLAYKEVLLRLANGQVLGSFSDNPNGKMTRLAFLPDGTYMNTDNSGCVFTLSTSSDGSSRSISWWGEVQDTWAL
jgi:hypothetical protein